MKPDFREAANRHASLIYRDDYTKRICGAADFQIGAHHGYDLAMEQHRDFYLLVRSYFSATAYLSSHAKETPERALRLQECQQYTKMILQRLEAFTSREIESLPFKD